MGSKGFNLRESSLPLYCRPQQQQGVSFPATPGSYILLSILAILITYLNVWSPNTAEHETRVQNTHHKFMRASYMKHFAKFLAILHHIASFFNFCFIINFCFITNLLHILEILKYYCCLCHSATDCH